MSAFTRAALTAATLLACLLGALCLGTASAGAAPVHSAPVHSVTVRAVAVHSVTVRAVAPDGPTAPATPSPPSAPKGSSGGDISVNVGTKPSQSVNILLLITVLSVAPSLLLLVTSFTKIFVVLSLTRNALGLTTVPPNQVLAGLSLFLSMFVMGPVLKRVNTLGIQPYLHGTKSRDVAWTDGTKPLREFMLAHTRPQEIALMLRAGQLPNPADKSKLELTTIIPAFVLSELRAAFIIGFVIFIPFLVIDLVVSAALMSMGMMMLPPVMISLPFKILLFVLVDGWGLIVTALIKSYSGG
jgi:flagellar biosynthesis protein FliP